MLVLQEFSSQPISHKLQKIYTRILTDNNLVTDLDINTIYLIKEQPSYQNIYKLKQILSENNIEQKQITKDFFNDNFIVAPRVSTVSPWCSKALDILSNCNITDITHIEQGITVKVTLSPNANILSNSLKYQIASEFYDKMTQSIIGTIDNFNNYYGDIYRNAEQVIDFKSLGKTVITDINNKLNLALNDVEIDYLVKYYSESNKTPTIT